MLYHSFFIHRFHTNDLLIVVCSARGTHIAEMGRELKEKLTPRCCSPIFDADRQISFCQ